MTENPPVGVLFVCLGNICRSPLARGIFRQVVTEAGLSARFRVDSAGTSDYHIGEGPDPRTVATARSRGLRLTGAARQVTPDDLRRFDYVLAMDSVNLTALRRLEPRPVARVGLLREFEDGGDGEPDVPDPYFGGAEGFDVVHDIIERSCRGLLAHIRSERGL